jgi:CAAX prenyl protease-like protein
MAFIGIGEAAQFMAHRGMLTLEPETLYYLYPVKTFAVALLLYAYRGDYHEFSWSDLARGKSSAVAVIVGIITCVMWVLTDWTLNLTGASQGFDPGLLPQGAVRILMTLTRVAGAVLVVPLMEELFWRSFLLRYIIDPDFDSVPIGRFTWGSFLCTTLLFGLEHHLVLAGMIAGAVYSALLYKTRSITHCVLAHAVTNLALAGYVLYSGRWYFW